MRPRSPIEAMVDAACGFDPNKPPPREPIKAEDPETQAVLDVCEAAAAWVRSFDGTKAEARTAEDALRKAARVLVASGW